MASFIIRSNIPKPRHKSPGLFCDTCQQASAKHVATKERAAGQGESWGARRLWVVLEESSYSRRWLKRGCHREAKIEGPACHRNVTRLPHPCPT